MTVYKRSTFPDSTGVFMWLHNARIRREVQVHRTDKEAELIRQVDLHKITKEEACSILEVSPPEWDVLYWHYQGSMIDAVVRTYINYFIHEIMGDDDVEVQEWINIQRETFKYAKHFEQLLNKTTPAIDNVIADNLNVTEQEYVRLLVEYLGSPPFLVEDYESIDWD